MRKERTSIIWTIDKEKLQKIVDESRSLKEMLAKLNCYNGSHRPLQQRIKEDNINTEKYIENNKNYWLTHNRKYNNVKIPIGRVLVENSNYCRNSLKKRLIEENLKEYKCSECGVGDCWNGKKLSLQIDHINGINNDNRLTNLRFICPNCHSQSDTFSGRNRKNYTFKRKIILCEICKKETKGGVKCAECYNKNIKLSFEVDKETLTNLVNTYPITAVGKMFNVTDNSIRKRCKRLNITIPKNGRGYWSKIKNINVDVV